MIEIKKLSKTFNQKGTKRVQALQDVNLTIHQGEIFGIIGYSGAGKSTLIRMLNLLEVPTEGNIVINGVDLTTLSPKELRKRRQKIGMIFQHFNLLWSRTVRENVAFPLEIARVDKHQIDQKVKHLLFLVGLEDKADMYPAQLSGGQKQRVGIARALANDPEVLLSDESTSALDPKTTDSILELLQKINRELGITIILITHEMHVVQKICHRVAVLENGRIVESGSVLDLFSNPKAPITKEFVNQVIEHEQDWKAILNNSADDNSMLIRCKFVGESAQKPIISQLIKQFDLEINILQGQISRLQHTSFGTLYLELIGLEQERDQGIQFLKDHQVEVEILGRGEG